MGEPSIKLPPAILKGNLSVEESISRRRSIRRLSTEPIPLWQLSQLLWSAQGITGAGRYRTVPSAGATFPLEMFALVGEQTVESLSAGIYHYETGSHSLGLHLKGDFRQELAEVALDQDVIASCPVNIVICALFSRTTNIYGERGKRYVHMEVGHLGQNVSLQAIALGLATVMIGAFHDEGVSKVVRVYEPVRPLYIIPVGRPI